MRPHTCQCELLDLLQLCDALGVHEQRGLNVLPPLEVVCDPMGPAGQPIVAGDEGIRPSNISTLRSAAGNSSNYASKWLVSGPFAASNCALTPALVPLMTAPTDTVRSCHIQRSSPRHLLPQHCAPSSRIIALGAHFRTWRNATLVHPPTRQ